MTVREAAPGKTARTRSRDQGRGRSDATNTVATRGRETLKNTSTARGARRSRTVSRTGVAGLNGFARDARWWSSSLAPIEFELARVRAVQAARNQKPLKRKCHVPRRRVPPGPTRRGPTARPLGGGWRWSPRSIDSGRTCRGGRPGPVGLGRTGVSVPLGEQRHRNGPWIATGGTGSRHSVARLRSHHGAAALLVGLAGASVPARCGKVLAASCSAHVGPREPVTTIEL